MLIAVCAIACTPNTGPKPGAISLPSPLSCDRIVSLAPSITETLFAVGLGDKVVGVTDWCGYPAAATRKASVGGYMDPSMEAIIAQSPTLVVLLSEHGAAAEKLNSLDIDTLRLSNSSVDDIHQSIIQIGRTCSVLENAKSLWSRLAAEMERIETTTRHLPRVRTLITMGRNMGSGGIRDVFVAGRQTFYNDLIRLAGGENAYTGEVPVPMLSQEGLIALDPEVIVDIVPRSLKGDIVMPDAAAADWQLLPLEAVRQGRVHVLEAPYAVIPGPRFVRTLQDLARMMHGIKGDL